jgi:hypothetical protein
MNTAHRADPFEGTALRADLSALEIDIHCALVLARIALQTLADADPAHNARIQRSLDEAVDNARLEGADRADAVVGLLTALKSQLSASSERTRILYLE